MKRLKLDIQLFAEEDGWITIGAKLDSKQLEKDLKNEKSKLEKFEKEAEKLNEQKIKIDAEVELKGKEFDRKVKEIQDKAKIDIQAISGGSYASRKAREQKIEETAQLKINQLTQQYKQYLEQADNKIENIDKKLQENAHNQGLVNNNIEEMSSKLKQVRGFETIKGSVENVGNSLQKVTKRIAKMAIAVFGIRSAFMFVRNSINAIAQDDDQLSDDIQYMKIALAYTIEPIVRGIVNLAKQLMFYVAYIVKAWTGRNIFENANKGLANANKKAKELQKLTASFDEMNVLNDSGKGDEAISPSFDLSAPENIDAPAWIKWIAENKDIVIAGLMGIASALVAVKLGVSGLMALGIGLIITGIILLIKDVIKFIKDPSWNNFANILRDLTIILAGVAVAMLAVNAANPVAWILLAIAAVVAIAAAVIKNWDKIKGVLGVVGSWIYDHIIKPVGDFFSGLWNGIVNGAKGMVNGVKSFILGIPGFVNGIINGIGVALGKFGAKVGDIIGGAFKGVINGVLSAIENILNSPIKAINKLLGIVNKISPIKIGTLSTFRLPRLAKGGIINMPGRGVPVGGASAIAGERGQEGVIPLTDSQQMDLLGQAIARHMVINNFVDNYIDGRKLNRILQSSNDRTRFAMNG